MEYVPAKTIVTRNKSEEWFGARYNMNIYRGCCHGCIYCDSRSDCYRIEDFGRVRAKENALKIIRDDLRRKVQKGVVATGAMSDPYNPHERELELTRHAIELVSAYGFGIGISTKSPLVTRDTDVLLEVAEHSPVIIKITITTADDDLSRVIEPNAAPSSERFAALEQLSSKGVYCGVLMMPLLPYINDSEENVLTILRRAGDSGARFVYPSMGLTLRDGQREYFYSALDRSFPGLSAKYASRYGSRYQAPSPHAKALYERFERECRELGLLYRMRDIIRSYKKSYEPEQLTFL